jgi:molybdate transport system substrate-binding protein
VRDDLRLLSAGAAQGVVEALRAPFRAASGAGIDATFGAVGALAEKLEAGERCDVVILTATMIAGLDRHGQLVTGTSAPLGRVRTGVAVRAGDPLPTIGERAGLAAALRSAPAVYVPDTTRSTAGIHVADVLRRLGLADELAPRLSIHPNGATAMRALAAANVRGAIGCTQITEIRYTPGIALVGPLPAEFELATVYSVAVTAAARDLALARQFATMVAGPDNRALRESAGFEAVDG